MSGGMLPWHLAFVSVVVGFVLAAVAGQGLVMMVAIALPLWIVLLVIAALAKYLSRP